MNPTENETIESLEKEAPESQKLVPVVESIRYRKRAQSAEKKMASLEKALAENQSTVQRLNRQLENQQRRHQLLLELTSAGARDLETASLLAGKRLEENPNADLPEVVAGLKKEKAYLFAQAEKPVPANKTAGVREKMSSIGNALEKAARQAAQSGSRRDLQEYLRLRRNFI